jgi:methionyl-tRNA synthetase
MLEVKPEITIEDLSKIDIRIGTIVAAEKVEGSEKLLKLQVDFGVLGQRQILTGMQKWYSPEQMVGLQTTFIVNLKPRKMMGLESHGMIYALGLTDDAQPVFLRPNSPIENGNGAR